MLIFGLYFIRLVLCFSCFMIVGLIDWYYRRYHRLVLFAIVFYLIFLCLLLITHGNVRNGVYTIQRKHMIVVICSIITILGLLGVLILMG
jgi:hypothetical protein